jgi:hypothetical protein
MRGGKDPENEMLSCPFYIGERLVNMDGREMNKTGDKMFREVRRKRKP